MVTNWKNLTLSIVFHLLIIAAFFIKISEPQYGHQDKTIVHAYLLQPTNKPVIAPHSVIAPPPVIARNEVTKQTQSRSTSPPKKSPAKPQRLPRNEAPRNDGGKRNDKDLSPGLENRLYTELHNAIQSALIYPSRAQFLNLTGTALVRFLLLPSGQITNVQIIHSSNSALLDQSAIATIRKITPFLPAKHNLHVAHTFSINISFQ